MIWKRPDAPLGLEALGFRPDSQRATLIAAGPFAPKIESIIAGILPVGTGGVVGCGTGVFTGVGTTTGVATVCGGVVGVVRTIGFVGSFCTGIFRTCAICPIE